MNMKSLICFVLSSTIIINAFRVFNMDGIKTILALENEDISIDCKGENVSYCGFISPTGIRNSYSDFSPDSGNCSLKIKASKNVSGEWKCRTGSDSVGVESIDSVRLRVADELAAVVPFIAADHHREVTLACVTTKESVPLRYCRFEPPVGSPFKIDSTITVHRAILDNYYYPPDMSLENGECAVNIGRLKLDDVGIWTCCVGLADGHEFTTSIEITMQRYRGMLSLSTAGLVISVIAVALILSVLLLLAWRKLRQVHDNRDKQVFEIQELGRSLLGSSIAVSSPNKAQSVPAVVIHSPTQPKESPIKTV